MARPRKDQEGPSAVERMEEAFWEALSEKPYGKISVGEIAQRARVNKNAFYYHYSGLHVLAAQAIDNTLPREFARMILLGNGLDTVIASAAPRRDDLERRASLIRLVAGAHGSRELTALLKDRMLHAWLDIFAISETDLDRQAVMTLEFALGGILEVIGNERLLEGGETLPQALFGLDIAKSTAEAVIAALRTAAKRSPADPTVMEGNEN